MKDLFELGSSGENERAAGYKATNVAMRSLETQVTGNDP